MDKFIGAGETLICFSQGGVESEGDLDAYSEKD